MSRSSSLKTSKRYRPKNSEWIAQSEWELLRYYAKQDFWLFFCRVFGAYLNPKGRRWIDDKIHYPLARWFQDHIVDWQTKRDSRKPEQKHLAVLIHREVGKTTMITQAGQLWLHLRDPEISSYTGSEKMELSQKFLGGMKGVLDGSDPYALFTRLYGNWATGARTWTGKHVFHTARKNTARNDPSLGTFAVETSITGAHPDAIFYDDPISYERMNTDETWLETVNDQVDSLVPVIQSDGLIVWVGTRYDDDDHFGVAFREDGIKSIEGMPTDQYIPEPDGVWDVYFMAGRDRKGQPSTPKTWPEDRLRRWQNKRPVKYAAQIMNDPKVSETNPITKSQIEQCVISKDDVPWNALRFYLHCDHAFADGNVINRKDETVVEVWGHSTAGTGIVYFIEGYSAKTWRGRDLAKRIVSIVQRYRMQGRKVSGITNDLQMGGSKGTWRDILYNYFRDADVVMPALLEFPRGNKSKYSRMEHAAEQWVNGFAKLVDGAPGLETLKGQMLNIGQYALNPKSTPVDWSDAGADAFHPDIYVKMKRPKRVTTPYDRGIPIHVDGLDDYEDYDRWRDENPRPPIR